MTPVDSVTHWYQRLANEDADAARKLWERYYRPLVTLARRKLGKLRTRDDEEDVVLSAFKSFCRAVREKRFADVEGRDDLWTLLVMLTSRKAIDRIAHARRKKRDVRREEPLAVTNADGEEVGAYRELISGERDPAFAAEVAEEFERLLEALKDDEMREIVVAKMEGHTNNEVAAQVGRSHATVERRLDLARKILKRVRPE